MRKDRGGGHARETQQAANREPQTGTTRFRERGKIVEFQRTPDSLMLVLSTKKYETWINGIVDMRTNVQITRTVGKMRRGLFGDWKDVGEGVFELRLDFGPGYRVYYAKVGHILIALLGGGDKGTQQRDIASAQKLWKELRDEIEQL